jgi:hypothetical protein
MAQVVEHLPRKRTDLSSNLNTTKRKKNALDHLLSDN